MPKTDGGPAFPRETRHGMTLRDYFAAKAMVGLLSFSDAALGAEPTPQYIQNNSDAAGWYSALAYKVADAMLAEREKS